MDRSFREGRQESRWAMGRSLERGKNERDNLDKNIKFCFRVNIFVIGLL